MILEEDGVVRVVKDGPSLARMLLIAALAVGLFLTSPWAFFQRLLRQRGAARVHELEVFFITT